jgi:putative endonuclease
MNTKSLGKKGEEIAVNYLKSKGYKIIDRNFFLRAAHGPKIAEVDIVAQKRGVFVFVEVKTIKHYPKLNYLPQDKVNAQKLWKISKAAEFWLMKNKIPPFNIKWQIDVITVEIFSEGRPKIIESLFGPKTKISHFENVTSY